MPTKVLLVEDDAKMSDIVKRLLEAEEMSCDCVTTGEEATQVSRVCNYDIVILDIGLPDTTGHDLLNRLRKSSINVPVLILSGVHTIRDKIKALGFGADDYLTKPFVGDELVARIKALSRRASGHSSTNICVGAIELNMETKNIFANGALLDLTGKEYDILEFLLLRNGSTITKAHFLSRLYPSTMDEPEAKIIDVFIHKLRKKLESALGASGRDYISTVWGRGYSLRDPQNSREKIIENHNVISLRNA